jgi:aminoglycoside phosphotransferase
VDVNLSQKIAELALGQAVLKSEPLTGGEDNQVFCLTLESLEKIVVRLHSRTDAFAGAVETINTLKALDLPTPEVLATGKTEEISWQILRWTEGTELRWAIPTLSHAQQSIIAEKVVLFQRRVGTLPKGKSFGYLSPNATGKDTTWRELLAHHRSLSKASPDITVYLSSVAPVCFLDDITGKNILIENGELTKLIDLDHVCYGDPLYWLALTQVGLLCDIGDQGDFYIAELTRLWSPNNLEKAILAFYRALMTEDFLEKHRKNETITWQQRMDSARKRWFKESRAQRAETD